MGLLDYNPPDAKVLPPDYEPGFADYWWYDESDRRYCLDGPNACTAEEYWTTVDAQQFESDLEKNPNASPPAGMPGDIEEEFRESNRNKSMLE